MSAVDLEDLNNLYGALSTSAVNGQHRVGFVNTAGAPHLSSSQDWVDQDGFLVAVDGDPVASHGVAEHSSPVTANGDPWITIDGIPVNYVSDPDSCGHRRITPSWINSDT